MCHIKYVNRYSYFHIHTKINSHFGIVFIQITIEFEISNSVPSQTNLYKYLNDNNEMKLHCRKFNSSKLCCYLLHFTFKTQYSEEEKTDVTHREEETSSFLLSLAIQNEKTKMEKEKFRTNGYSIQFITIIYFFCFLFLMPTKWLYG